MIMSKLGNLQYKMFLLNFVDSLNFPFSKIFTIQNVSIKYLHLLTY